MTTTIGSNRFDRVPVPLVVGRRYFVLHSDQPPVLSVVYDDPAKGAVWEVKQNRPGVNATITPPGIVTVTDPASGQMVYKVRPGSETSVVFGNIRDGDLNVRITDRFIEVNTNRFERNQVSGFGAGIVVSEDGRGIAMGGQIPERVMTALVQAQGRPKT